MNTEDRLRDAVTAYTDSIEPAPDVWRLIRERVDRAPRPGLRPAWRVSLAGFAAAVAIALVVTLVIVVRDEGRGRPVPIGPGPAPVPSQVVGRTLDGRVVVLDSSTGEEIRALSSAAGWEIAVSPNGARVFFDRASSTRSECISGEIVSVPTDGGAEDFVAAASYAPAVSPDGGMLAFVNFMGPAGCNRRQTLVVMSMEDPSRSRGWTVEGPEQEIATPSWAPDSRHVRFSFFDPADNGGSSYARVLDTQSADSFADARDVPIPRGLAPFGYLGTTGDVLGALAPPGEPRRFVALDPETGAVQRDLFPIVGEIHSTPVSDASGSHVLYVGADEVLYRQSEGDAQPTKVADGIVAAAWVPDPSEPLPATTEASKIQVRDVLALDPNTARRELEGDGFTVDVEYRTGTDRPGFVVAQQPEPGASAARASAVTIVVGAFEPCGGFFAPTELPEGFDPESRTGPAPEAAGRGVPVDPRDQVVVHYTDSRGRSIEIRRPATLFVEILGRDDEPPDAYILGQAVEIAPIAPTIDEPMLAPFSFPDGSPDDPCTSYSVNGYGVTEAELRTFAESLFTVP